jgi:hypothetical protein
LQSGRRSTGLGYLIAVCCLPLFPFLAQIAVAAWAQAAEAINVAARPPAATRPPAPHTSGRVAPPRRGITFTTAHGCNPRADWDQVDSRVRTVLQGMARHHRIRVSCLRTGHSRFVKGTTRVSNHTVGRAVDIDMVDGRPVAQKNLAAYRLADAVGRGRFGAQPSEVGSPWPFGHRPWFTDSGHQGHLHIGFGPR